MGFIKLLILLVAVCTVAITVEQVYAGNHQGGSPPKVDIFANPQGDAILVTWENPDDTQDNVVFRYTVSRSVNDDGNYVAVFDSLRDLEQRIISPQGREMFFFLDENVSEGNCYVYRVGAGRTEGNPNPNNSDDTRCIEPQILDGRLLSTKGFLIQSTTPYVPQPPLLLGFFMAFAQQNPILTTSQNPQGESFQLALAPTTDPSYDQDGCDQTISIHHQKDIAGGQEIDIVVTLIENETPRNQGTIGTADSTKRIFSRDVFIPFPDQVIQNFTDLKIQLDFTAVPDTPPNHRAMSIYDVILYIPEDNAGC